MQLTMNLNDWLLLLSLMAEAEHDRQLKINQLRKLGRAYTALRRAINHALLGCQPDVMLTVKDDTRELLIKVLSGKREEAPLRLLARLRGEKLPAGKYDPTTPEQQAAAARLREQLEAGEIDG